MSGAQRSLARLFRHYLLNPVAVGYLVVVAAVLVWIGVDLRFVDHPDASFSGVWAFIVTAPTSLLFAVLPDPLLWLGVPVGALVQAGVFGAAYRWFTDRPRRHPRTGSA